MDRWLEKQFVYVCVYMCVCVCVLYHVFPGNRLTRKDDADSGAQLITAACPRQSLLLAKDPDPFL